MVTATVSAATFGANPAWFVRIKAAPKE